MKEGRHHAVVGVECRSAGSVPGIAGSNDHPAVEMKRNKWCVNWLNDSQISFDIDICGKLIKVSFTVFHESSFLKLVTFVNILAHQYCFNNP